MPSNPLHLVVVVVVVVFAGLIDAGAYLFNRKQSDFEDLSTDDMKLSTGQELVKESRPPNSPSETGEVAGDSPIEVVVNEPMLDDAVTAANLNNTDTAVHLINNTTLGANDTLSRNLTSITPRIASVNDDETTRITASSVAPSVKNKLDQSMVTI